MAEEDAVRQLHLLPFPATAVAFPAGREEAISKKKLFSIPQAFVLNLPAELPHAYVADGTGKLAIPLHPLYVEIFQGDHLRAERGIDLSCLMKQLLHLFLDLFLLGLGFRYGQKRGQMGFEADAFTGRERCMNKETCSFV